MNWDAKDILSEKQNGARKTARIVATNKPLLTLQFRHRPVQHLLDIGLDKQTRRLHAQIAQLVVYDRLEVVLPVLRVVDFSSDEDRARAQNDLSVAYAQLPRKTLDALEADHQAEELVQSGPRGTAVENSAMAAHLLSIGHNRATIPQKV